MKKESRKRKQLRDDLEDKLPAAMRRRKAINGMVFQFGIQIREPKTGAILVIYKCRDSQKTQILGFLKLFFLSFFQTHTMFFIFLC